MAKKTPAQERLANKRKWHQIATRAGHKVTWKLVKANRSSGRVATYWGTCKNCPATIVADEFGAGTENMGISGRKRCRGGR